LGPARIAPPPAPGRGADPRNERKDPRIDTARAKELARQLAAGLVAGITGVIFAMTWGALLFAGPLERFLGYGLTTALVALLVGSLIGWASREKALIAGADSNSTSLLAAALAGLGTVQLAAGEMLHVALAVVFATSIVCALTFWLMSQRGLANIVRFVPFPVMAGFLASSGWLLCLGAMTILIGTPLSLGNAASLLQGAWEPVAGGLAVALVLLLLSSRLPGSVLMPIVIALATLVVHVLLASPLCADACEPSRWLFPPPPEASWLPPWKLRLDGDALGVVAGFLPTMLVVAFVALLAVVLTLASLEIELQREFDLGHELRVHAGAATLAGGLGGMIATASISRTALNQRSGGTAVAGLVSAGMALAMLLGASHLMGYVARAALGGLVLYLGIAMLRQWVWDVRHAARPVELLQILLIVAITARDGFIAGFGVGVLIACVTFVVTYSRIPLTDLATHLGEMRSSVVRSSGQERTLATHGEKVLVYRLGGYVFFGSASKIDGMFKQRLVGAAEAVVLDFSRVSGIDTSALTVFQRILRRHSRTNIRFHFVYGPPTRLQLVALGLTPGGSLNLKFHESLDRALEAAEEGLLEGHEEEAFDGTLMRTASSLDWRSPFEEYLETREVAENEALFHEGDGSDEVYFVESGRFDVLKDVGDGMEVRLAKVRQGALLGEIAFYLGEPRSATIVATRPSTVRVMRRSALERMRSARPDLATQFDHMVIRNVAESLKRTNQLVTTLT
jgi:SulP family sulfate permease